MDKYTAYVTDKNFDLIFSMSDLCLIIPFTYKRLCEFLNSRDENEELAVLLLKNPSGARENEIVYSHDLKNPVSVKEAKEFLKNYKRGY